MAREQKSDRLSFVLDKELTPILKVVAEKNGITQSKLINLCVLNILMDNIDLLEDKEQIEQVRKLIRAKRRGF